MKRGKFSLSHTKLMSGNMGVLYPITCYEVLPGDTVQHVTSLLLRCAPMMAPVMHPVRVRIHHWFVPNRLLWDNWEPFITGGPDGNNASVTPKIHMPNTVGFAIGSLADHFGLPTGVDGTGSELDVSALPFRAYAKIWNENYRDQDLQTAVGLSTGDGLDSTTNTALQNVCWEKDYFTSARPWEQKGPTVTVPLGSTAPVARTNNAPQWGVREAGTNATPGAQSWSINASGLIEGTSDAMSLDPRGGLVADLSSASAITVNLLREALSMQRYEEARARYGSRYVEYLRYLGVRSSDARLDRPEYLGGGLQTIQFSEVLQTAEGTDPVGEMRGHGIATARSNRWRKFFEEHGIVITLLSVQPKTMYMDGIPRMWSRTSKEMYWQKEFQHIGQQEIPNKEIFANHTTPLEVWGWQDRYDEYRRAYSLVSGEMRDTLDEWHFARQFGSDPALNADFVKCVPTEEPFAVPSADVLYVQAKHSIQKRSLLAQVGTSSTF